MFSYFCHFIMFFCFIFQWFNKFTKQYISYSGSTLPVIVFYGRLKVVNYSEVSVECGSVTQTQQLSTANDSKYDDRTSSIRLSIIILGVFCIVMILLHVSLSVIMRNDMKIEPVSIQIEEINYDSI